MEYISVYVRSIVILILVLPFVKNSSCVNIVEELKDAVLNSENIFGETVIQIGKMASQLNFVKTAWEDSVEEDCVYSCSNGKKPVPNKYYTPHSNGCGVTGIEIKLDNLPIKDMTKCCDDHDICYGTCRSNKDSCDLQFKQCLYRICDNKLGKIGEPLGCKTGAKMLYTGTNVLGCKFFKNAQKEACYCPQEKNRKYRGNDEL